MNNSNNFPRKIAIPPPHSTAYPVVARHACVHHIAGVGGGVVGTVDGLPELHKR